MTMMFIPLLPPGSPRVSPPSTARPPGAVAEGTARFDFFPVPLRELSRAACRLGLFSYPTGAGWGVRKKV